MTWASPPLLTRRTLDQVEDDVGGRVRQLARGPCRSGGGRQGPGVETVQANERIGDHAGHLGDVGLGGRVGVVGRSIGALYRTATLVRLRRAHFKPTLVKLAWRILTDQVRVADPMPFSARMTRSLVARSQAGQGVGLDEVRDAVADPEVDPGEVAATAGRTRDTSSAATVSAARPGRATGPGFVARPGSAQSRLTSSE